MRNINLKTCALIIISIFITINVNALNKKEVRKLNRTIIFDMYINYELTGRNYNLSTIFNYLPKQGDKSLKSSKITSNAGGTHQVLNVQYNKRGYIEKLSFEVNRRIYHYEFVWKKHKLIFANIAGKKKIEFTYDKKGRLSTLTRHMKGRSGEYSFVYKKGENKADIKLNVLINGKKRKSHGRRYISWNDYLNMEAYSLEEYSSKQITYNLKEDVETFVFGNVISDNNKATWEYKSFDNKDNWTERKFKNTWMKRTFQYN